MFKYGNEEFKVRDLAYAGAILDGEGCLTGSSSGDMLNTHVAVYNTDKSLIDWLHGLFGGSIYHRPSKNEKHADSYTWRIESKRIQWFLRLLIPFMKIKQPQAYLLMAIRDGIEKKKKRERTKKLIEKLQDLNTKGPERPKSPETTYAESLKKPSVRDLAYMAGLLDGEGSIFKSGYTLRVTVVNREKNLIEWCQQKFGGYVYTTAATDKHADTYIWQLSQTDTSPFLQSVLPYLKQKRANAEELIAYRERYSPLP